VFCGTKELEIRRNNLLTDKGPLYSYQKLNEEYMPPLEETRRFIASKRQAAEEERKRSPNEEVEQLLKEDVILKYKE
jgi:hypothetical protein